jgi:hypothetical protein
VGNGAQTKNNLGLELKDFLTQEGKAVANLRGGWLILRRQALHGIGDSAVMHHQRIVCG